MKTKLLTLLLCLLTTLPALAADFQVDWIYYNITSDNTVEVTSDDNNNYAYSESITIPTEVQYANKTYSVTAIGSYAFYGDNCQYLTSVTIPNSVTEIGYGAFHSCSGLTSLTIPNSVTSIGDFAFRYCTGLTSMTIPNSVTEIGSSAFDHCTGLTSVTIPNSVTTIGSSAFDHCSSLTQIEVDNDNKAYCSIDGVLFNKNKTTIITYPARKSNSDQYIIPSSVTSIGYGAFYNCTSLTSITIPNSVTSIGSYAFGDCTGLTSITLPNSLTSIGNYAFYSCSSLTSVTIPNSVTEIGRSTFSSCTSLTSITLPNSLTSIGDFAFYGCTSLTSITLPNSLTSIGDFAFYGCTSLTSITLPNSLTSIGDYSFRGCTGLTSITLPNSITSIGNYAFYGCTGLTEIYCEAEVPPTCYDGTFGNTLSDVVYANYTLYVPAVAVEAYRTTAPWNKFVNIVGVDNNEVEVPEEPTWQTAVSIEEESTQALFVPYVWASSDEAVASVSQTGEVTAVAPGTCTVTFTCGETVYSCVVTVSNKSTGRAEVSSVSPAVAYDLQGRRVSNPHRGIFIVNGQKQRLN